MDNVESYADGWPIPAVRGAGPSTAVRAIWAVSDDDVQASQAGLAATFDEWVTARGPGLLRFAYLLIGDAGRAEEAVQEALATACGRWSHIMRADSPEAYVRRMIVNADISGWRRFRRRETPVAEVFGAGAEPTSADPTHAVGEVDAMWALCATLPRRQRAAVVLRYYEGLPDADIARILGCAEVTVRSQIHRALATLRGRLSTEERAND